MKTKAIVVIVGAAVAGYYVMRFLPQAKISMPDLVNAKLTKEPITYPNPMAGDDPAGWGLF